MDETPNRSAASLLGDLAHQIPELFRKELQLFRAEIGEKTNQAFAAIGMIVGGLVIALTALNVLAAALVAALEEAGLAAGWAALIVGVGLAIVAYLLARKGADDLKATNLAPNKTARAVSKDAQMAKEKIS